MLDKNPSNPKCPICNANMIGYENEDTINWSCSMAPECKGFISGKKKLLSTPRKPVKKKIISTSRD